MSDQPVESAKRHPALQPLSRHHHHALVVAMRLSRQSAPLEELRSELQKFWEEGGRDHFREEEEVLLPVYAKYQPIDLPVIRQMLIEHVLVRSLAAQIAAGAGAETMVKLGELLRDHVRTEERVIFPMMEQGIPENELRHIMPWFSEHLSASVFYDGK